MPFSIKNIFSNPQGKYSRNIRTCAGQASTEELYADLNNMHYKWLHSTQQKIMLF